MPKWFHNLPPVVTLIILSTGLIGAWFTNKASVAAIQAEQSELQTQIEGIEQRTHMSELSAARDSQEMVQVKEDIREIRNDIRDIKKLLINRDGR